MDSQTLPQLVDAMDQSESPPPPSAISREPRWYAWACFLLTLAGLQLALGPKIRLSQWKVQASANSGVAEGESWLNGRLDIPQERPDLLRERMHDTALVNEKVYNVFPPLMGFLTVALAPLHRYLIDRTDMWLALPYVLLVFWPVPIISFIVFRRQTGDSAWAGLLTLAYMGGTALLPNLYFAGSGNLGQTNHVLSQVGLLIFAADMLGRRRIWPSLIGLTIAVWTRQMTILYALPLIAVAWQKKRLMLCLAGLAVMVAPLLTLNYLKFGKPWDSGYQYIYVGREGDGIEERFQAHGLFSAHFIPENAYYMHIEPPQLDIEPTLTSLKITETNQMGTSLWITSPLLLFVFLAAPSWFRDGPRRLLILATLPVMLGLLCYHSTGYLQHGYNRFALDFIPIWLAVIAGQTRGGWRTWFTLGCTAWALLYFQAIVPDA
ncbi:MAG TPA: hypothetical protein VJZ71_06110 [Phycisphaerae bacterium]|nr:hypothetical protein [Phycisphaerae bacterium]